MASLLFGCIGYATSRLADRNGESRVGKERDSFERLNPPRLNDASHSLSTAWVTAETRALPDADKRTEVKDKCIFCGVTSQSEGFRVVHEDPEMVIFHDRSPASRVHMLAVPKRHIDNVKTLRCEDTALIERMKEAGRCVLREQGVPDLEQRLGFHIPPFYSVNHLHLHLLSLPLPFPGSIKYRPSIPSSFGRQSGSTRGESVPPKPGREKLKGFSWFVEVDQVLAILKAGERVRVGSVHGRSATRTSDQP